MSGKRSFLRRIRCLIAATCIASAAFAQAPSSTLLVLAKSDHTVAIVDPATLQVLGRVAAGPDPHEIITSDDGKLAFISNYGGSDSALNTISVVDLVAQKALPPIDLGALRSTHGLAFAGGKLYFTAETNKVIKPVHLKSSHLRLFSERAVCPCLFVAIGTIFRTFLL